MPPRITETKGVIDMAKRKLALLRYRRQAEDGSLENRTCVLLVFNRDLHPLEAMGIFHLLEQSIKDSSS